MLFHMMLNHVVEFGWRPKICLTNIQQCSCIRYTSFAMAPLNRQSLSIYTKDVTEVGSMSLEICLEFVVTTSHVRNEFHSWILHGDLNAMYLRCRKQVANVSPSDIEIMLQLCSTATFIWSRSDVPMRCRNQVALVSHYDFRIKVASMSHCDVAIRSQLCHLTTFR